MRASYIFYLSNRVFNKAWAQVARLQEQIFEDMLWKEMVPS